MLKRLYVQLLVLSMILLWVPLESTRAASVELVDIKGHWAEQDILEWVQQGIITGYPDQTFRPDDVISRGEFVSLVNKAFKFSASKTTITFKDLKPTDWVYSQVQTAVAQGYINGYSDQTFRQKQNINRQETATILNKLLKLDSITLFPTLSFNDSDQIPGWSKAAVQNMLGLGIMDNDKNDSFQPQRLTTRAEAVVSIKQALARSSDTDLDLYTEAGSYGTEELQTINKDVVVDAGSVTLRNMHIKGDLLISEKVGAGDVYLEGVTVDGTTRVEGGGRNSIHIKNSTIPSLVVNRINGLVRIVAEGNTVIDHSEIITSVILEENKLEGTGFATVLITGEQEQAVNGVAIGKSITLIGDFRQVNIETNISRITLQSGNIDLLTANKGLSRMSIITTKDVKVGRLDLQSNASITGEGQFVEINMGDGAKDTTLPSIIVGGGDSSLPQPGSGGGTGGGNGGGSNPNPAPTQTPVALQLSEIQASNGAIKLVFNKALQQTPVVNDFEVNVRIDQGSTVKVTELKIEETQQEHVFKLTVPTIENGNTSQTVYYTVKYKPTNSTASSSFKTMQETSKATGIVYFQPYNMLAKKYQEPLPFRDLYMMIEDVNDSQNNYHATSNRNGEYVFNNVKPGEYKLFTSLGWTTYYIDEPIEILAGQEITLPKFIIKQDAPKVNSFESVATDRGVVFVEVWYLDDFSIEIKLEDGTKLNVPSYRYDQFVDFNLFDFNSDLVLTDGMKLYFTISADNGWKETIEIPVIERPITASPLVKDIVYDDNEFIVVTVPEQYSTVTIYNEDGTLISRYDHSNALVRSVDIDLKYKLEVGEILSVYVQAYDKQISKPLLVEVQAPTEPSEMPELTWIQYTEYEKRMLMRVSTQFNTNIYVKTADGTILTSDRTWSNIDTSQLAWYLEDEQEDTFYVYAKTRGKTISEPLIVKVPVTETPRLEGTIYSHMTEIAGTYNRSGTFSVTMMLLDMDGNLLGQGTANVDGSFKFKNLTLTANTQYQLIARDYYKRRSEPLIFTVLESK